MRGFSFALLLLSAGWAAAAPSAVFSEPEVDLDVGLFSRADSSDLVPRAPTCNTPSNRACWTTGFNIQTDYEHNVPFTGKTVQYWFVITEHENWVGPDGEIKHVAMLINETFPGPNIVADWGDMVEVHVTNAMVSNGTSIHWHGVRMLNNNVNDGANGVTECPIPPGGSKTYRFLVEQYGPSWYHSHFSSQYANGLVGTLEFKGPASLPYEVDLGVLPITDWYYKASDEVQWPLNQPPPQAPPDSQNILFNGKHVNQDGTKGEYNKLTLQPGKRHKLSLINTSVDNTFIVSIVDHDMTVIQTDFVPVWSYTVSSVFLAVGQRYDVTIDASKAVDNYWLNVTLDSSGLCGTTEINKPAMILHYDGASSANPSKAGVVPPNVNCQDLTSFTPVVPRQVPAADFSVSTRNEIPIALDPNSPTVTWEVRGQDINITWDEPTLEYVAKGNTNFPDQYNVLEVPEEDEWFFAVILNVGLPPHPMHLHGHDFLILGHSPALGILDLITINETYFYDEIAFDPARDMGKLNLNNPTRRDSTMLPGWGWLVIAWKTDNPGAWLFHCHIAWHVSQGLGMQFLERVHDIPTVLTLSELEPTCADWTTYFNTVMPDKYDSGL